MASGDPFQVEDQTDEDFFDKLVGDDEFGFSGSGAAAADMARALSNMSLGDVGTSVDSFETEDKHGDEKLLESKVHEKASLAPKEIAPAELCNTDALDEAVQSSNPVKDEMEVGSPGSSAGKSTGSKGTSIKVVQWSSFSSGQGQLDMCGYGSYSDLFTGDPGGSASELVTGTDDKNTVAHANATFGSFETQGIQDLGVTSEQMTNLVFSEQIDSQAYGSSSEQVTAGNDSQYWENAYPGWTYDANTGQWYQVDSYVATKDDQADGYGSAVANYQESLLAGTELADDGAARDKMIGRDFYNPQNSEGNYVNQQAGLQTMGNVQKPLHSHSSSSGTNSFSSFMPAESSYQFNQLRAEHLQHANAAQSYYLNQNSVNYSQQFPQSGTASYSQLSYTPNGGRSLEGRPPHALVTFGFGGKLIVMKDTTSFGTNLTYGSQDAGKGEISVLNLAEVVMERADSSTLGNLSCDYFHSLCRQSFPGPLVGGNAATKDLNKWIDERITSCESSTMDFRKGELLRLLFSLLKISCQHYGKLRSPFGVDLSLQVK
ncbi:hypothetical protein Taro_031424 [Colocasia esculenta]|uniref:Sec16 central conserved domain-containing protein n=1 Tax=Colocasia esculenta TaxID=4460 RepID=A0A843VNV6_COLES|nr:hypothetical protein [Colocasia esculenta]